MNCPRCGAVRAPCHRQTCDLERLLFADSRQWPLKHVLPLKRTNEHGQQEHGFLHASDQTATVYLGNVFLADLSASLDRMSKIVYPSLQAMQLGGWKGD